MPLSVTLANQNSHAIEELFNYRLLHDLKLAAFVRDYHLLTYYTDVDHDGFDVILDDRDNLRKTQLKTVARGADTASWEIHKSILRPTVLNFEGLGFDFDVENPNPGVEGGVILIDYDPKVDTIDVRYFFTDIFLISAIALGLLPSKIQATVAAANTLRGNLHIGASNTKIGVAKGLFIEAASPQHLLALIGMHSEHATAWRMGVKVLANEQWGTPGAVDAATLEGHREADGVLGKLRTASGQAGL